MSRRKTPSPKMTARTVEIRRSAKKSPPKNHSTLPGRSNAPTADAASDSPAAIFTRAGQTTTSEDLFSMRFSGRQKQTCRRKERNRIRVRKSYRQISIRRERSRRAEKQEVRIKSQIAGKSS